jgi:hypothetical protein
MFGALKMLLGGLFLFVLCGILMFSEDSRHDSGLMGACLVLALFGLLLSGFGALYLWSLVKKNPGLDNVEENSPSTKRFFRVRGLISGRYGLCFSVT